MDWDKLKVFHSVADIGSFTHAAEFLGLSQSALSRKITNLEYEVKTELFHRHPRGLTLTDQGQILYESATRIFEELSLVESKLHKEKEVARGVLRITTTTGLGSIWLSPLLEEFCRQYPDIEIVLIFSDYEANMSKGEADIAIWLRKPLHQDLIQRKLFSVHIHAYASQKYLDEFGAPKTIDDLSVGHRIIAFGPQIPPHVQAINFLTSTPTTKNNKLIKPSMYVNTLYGIKRAVDAGIGIAAYPDYLDMLEHNNVRILQDIPSPTFDTYLVYAKENMTTKRTQLFRDFLIQKSKKWAY